MQKKIDEAKVKEKTSARENPKIKEVSINLY